MPSKVSSTYGVTTTDPVTLTSACVGAGVPAGLVASFALGRFVRTLLFQIEPSDPASFGTAVLIAAVALLGAALLPARPAAMVDPIAALRDE